MGIAPELLPHIFDLFTQGDRSMDRAEGGLGIGLTLVKTLTELHGGRVSAASGGPGQGSEFAIRLAASAPAASVAPAGPAPTRRNGRGARALIVDDNADTANSLARLLTRAGYRARAAYDGREAATAARELRPEFVLLDIGLPGMNGYEVAETLRNDESCTGAMFIAVSGYGDERSRKRSSAAGFDAHLVKPLDFDALLALLAERTVANQATR
jgi:CheY-like chemotaxis protein